MSRKTYGNLKPGNTVTGPAGKFRIKLIEQRLNGLLIFRGMHRGRPTSTWGWPTDEANQRPADFDQYTHDVSRREAIVSALRGRAPRSRCGHSLELLPGEMGPSPDAPSCPQCITGGAR